MSYSDHLKRINEIKNQGIKKSRNNINVFERSFDTLFDISANVIYGAAKGLEGLYDAGLTVVGGVGGLFDQDFQKSVKKEISIDHIGSFDALKNAKGSFINDMGAKGQRITRGVASGVGQMLPAVGANLVLPGSGLGVLGTSAAGTSTEQAFNEGAGYYKGAAYGAMSGLVEMATEKLTGGAFKNATGKGILDNVLIKASDNLLWKTAKEAAGEGFEEALSEFINPILQQATYNKDAEFLTKQHLNQIAESAVIGALTSVAYGGTLGNLKTTDMRISEDMSEIKELQKKRSALFSQGKLNSEMESSITDTITKKQERISKRLANMDADKKTKAFEKHGLKSMFAEDGKTLKSIKASEGYNTEAYSPQLRGSEESLKYKPTNKALSEDQIQAVRNAEKLSNKSNKFKTNVVFTDDLGKFDNKQIMGAYEDGVIYISPKADNVTKEYYQQKMIHELTHSLEGTKEYAKYADHLFKAISSNEQIFNKIDPNGKLWSKTLEAYKAQATDKNGKVDEAKLRYIVQTEMVSQYSEKLFTDSKIISELSKNKTVFQKVYDFIKNTIKSLGNKKNLSQEERDYLTFLKKAEKLYNAALEESQGGVKLSERFSLDSEGNKLTKEQQEFFKDSQLVDEVGNLMVMYHGTSKEFNTFQSSKGGEYGSGIYFANNKDTASFFGSRFTEKPVIIKAYLNMKNPYRINKTEYISKTQNITPNTLKNRLIKQGYDGIIGTGISGVDKQYIVFESNQVKKITNTKPTESDDIRYSVDSEGNQLSEQQQEYFKDSKAVDENGNLLVLYHGSPDEFTVFENNAGKNSGTPTGRHYFTPEKEYAEKYTYESKQVNPDGSLLQKTQRKFTGKKGEVKAYYLNMKKPLDLTNITDKDIEQVAEFFAVEHSRPENRNTERYQESIKSDIQKLNEQKGIHLEQWFDFYAGLTYNNDYLTKFGYDGVIHHSESGRHMEYAVLNSNQIKLTSNTNPTNSDDIRYSVVKNKILDEIDAEFGQKNTYMWSTYVLPNGNSLNPEKNTSDTFALDYEHSDFDNWIGNKFGIDGMRVLEDDCIKMNVTYPYLYLPKNRITQKQIATLKNIINNGQFEFDRDAIEGWIDNGNSSVYDMESPLLILSDKDQMVFDLAIYSADDIVKEINKAYSLGKFLTKSDDIRYSLSTEQQIELGKTSDIEYKLNDNGTFYIYATNQYGNLEHTQSMAWISNIKKRYGEEIANIIETNAMTNTVKHIKHYEIQQILSGSEYDYSNIVEKAKERYGTTRMFKKTGYINTDGTMLNMSGGRETIRSDDHRTIASIMPLTGSDAMYKYIELGNIRFTPEMQGMEMANMPTNEQLRTIKRYIESVNGELTLDIWPSGEKLFNDSFKLMSIEYQEGTSTSKIIKDITSFYKNGIIPKESEINQFRYSIDDIEVSDDLVAIHNLYENEAIKVLKLGGMPSPSIAVTKAKHPFDRFGDVTFVFDKETIDPSIYENKVYTRDAYTRDMPSESNYVRYSDASKFYDAFIEFANEIDDYRLKNQLDTLLKKDQRKDAFINDLSYKEGMKLAYLKSQGKNPRKVFTDGQFSGYSVDVLKKFADAHPNLKEIYQSSSELMKYESEIKKLLYDEWIDKNNNKGADEFKVIKFAKMLYGDDVELGFGKLDNFVRAAMSARASKYPARQYNETETRHKIDNMVNTKDKNYIKWLTEQVDKYSIFGDTYYRGDDGRTIRNDLSSLTEYMKSNEVVGKQVGLVYGLKDAAAKVSRQLRSLAEIKKYGQTLKDASDTNTNTMLSDALQELDEEVRDKMKRFYKHQNMRYVTDYYEDYYLSLAKVLKNDNQSIRSAFSAFRNLTPQIVEELRYLVNQIKEFPSTYMEAKPQRAVTNDEIKYVLLTKKHKALLEELKQRDIKYRYYDGTDGDRSRVLNSDRMKNVRWSIISQDNKREYTKKELREALTDVIGQKLQFGSGYGELSRKTESELIDIFVREIEKSKNKEATAQRIVDFVFDNAMFDNGFDDNAITETDYDTYNVLKAYRGKIDLDNIRQEIRYQYDKDKTPFLIWGKRKGQMGMTADVIAQELEEQGIHIESDNEADMFFDIVKLYEDARDRINGLYKQQKDLVTDVIGKERINVLKAELKSKIIDIMLNKGKPTDTAKVLSEKQKRIDKLDQEITKLEKQIDLLKFNNQEVKDEFYSELYNMNREIQNLKWEISLQSKRETKLQDTVTSMRDNINIYAEKIRDSGRRHKATMRLFERVDRVKNLENYAGSGVKFADEVIGLVKPLKRIKTWRGNISKQVREIMQAYCKTVDGKKLYDLLAKDDTDVTNPFAQMIEDIAIGQGDLTTAEIENLTKVLDNFVHNVLEYDQVFFDERKQSESELSRTAIQETINVIPLSKNGTVSGFRKFKNWLESPLWRFRRLGNYNENSILSKMFWEFQKGFNKQAEYDMKAAKHFEKYYKKYKKQIETWTNEIEISGIKISKGQAISLYLLSLREQAQSHMFNKTTDPNELIGEIVIMNDKYAKKDIVKAKEMAQTVTITPEIIEEIYNSFNESELEFVKLTHEYFNKISTDAKIEIDRKLFGVAGDTEENYFPIRVAEDEIYKQLGDQNSMNSLFSVYTASFNKKITRNANNNMVIENVLDVINRHTKQMSAYYGLAQPIKAFNRIWNSKQEDGNTLRKEIKKIDGNFESYVSKLLQDMQGNIPRKSTFDKFLSKIRGWGAKAALGTNPKVWVNQFVAIPAAHGIGMKYKDLAWGLGQAIAGKTNYDILEKYSPMMFDRFREGNNTDVGLLKQEAGLFGNIDKFTELTTKPIGAIDKLMCGAIWNAALKQTETKYKTKTDQYKAAAKIVEKAIIQTQANWTALFRPAILRESSSFLQLSTMFMSEPLQMFSQLAGSFDKYSVAKKLMKRGDANSDKLLAEAKKEMKHAFTSVGIDMVLLALIAQAFRRLKGKKDDDETFMQEFQSEMLQNVLGMFPFIRDGYSLMEGYDVTNMAYTGLTNVYRGIEDTYQMIDLMASGKNYTSVEIKGKLRRTILGLSQTFGVPIRNLEAYFFGIIDKFSPSSSENWYSNFYTASNDTYGEKMVEAISKGQDKYADTLLDLMLNKQAVNIENSELKNQIQDLYNKGFNVIPTQANGTFAFDNETIELTKKETEDFQAIYNQAEEEAIKLVESRGYSKLSDEVKAKSLKYIYNYYYNLAKYNAMDQDYSSSYSEYAKYLSLYQAAMLSSYKNSLSGNKKGSLLVFMNKIGIYGTKKNYALEYLGYTV